MSPRLRSEVKHIIIMQTFFPLEETQVRIMDLGQELEHRCNFYPHMKGIILKHLAIKIRAVYLISVYRSGGLKNQATEQKTAPWHHHYGHIVQFLGSVPIECAWNEHRVSNRKEARNVFKEPGWWWWGYEKQYFAFLRWSGAWPFFWFLLALVWHVGAPVALKISFFGQVKLFKIEKWFYDISVHHSKQYLQAGHFKQSPWQNWIFQSNLSLQFPCFFLQHTMFSLQ